MTNLVYFGSPSFSATILNTLIKNQDLNIVGIVTSPDQPVGRQLTSTPTPVAGIAAKYDLPVFKPEKLDDAHLAHLRLLKPDLFLVVSYGQIIPPAYLTATKTLNVHFSRLPKYRGALCVSTAIKNGDAETGITLMEMIEKLDAGPVIAQSRVRIDPEDNTQTLTDKLTQTAIGLLNQKLFQYLGGEITATAQDESLATYTPSYKTRTRQSAYLDWEKIKSALDGTNAVSTHGQQ